jgi:hypothetical protein
MLTLSLLLLICVIRRIRDVVIIIQQRRHLRLHLGGRRVAHWRHVMGGHRRVGWNLLWLL